MALGKPQSDLFDEAAASLLGMVWRPELTVEEIPAPQRIAPFAAAIAADVDSDEEEVGNGRLVLLHDPDGNPAWEGTFRCVTFARASVDPEMAADPLLAEVGWSWLQDALERRGADYAAPSGTVTAVSSKSFGSMEGDPDKAEVEIRASWTPVLTRGDEILTHVEAWQDLLCMVSGLPLLPDGVVPIPLHRTGRRRR
ncbi:MULTISPECIES: DUF3000 domain-containing protein [unclassified Propioniciclava]|uniref:DUF3000 domain-containing protein n=1 Tax=unclassified Propioniciclava TaxID=2642922 RepID=UPI001FB80F24|nr:MULTISPECIES: DUF3000 domain-containing protein [unclassified Propioniciclava]